MCNKYIMMHWFLSTLQFTSFGEYIMMHNYLIEYSMMHCFNVQ